MISFKKIVIFFTAQIFIFQIYSQENYLPGYLVNLKGDSIKGLIDYRNWAQNPKVIHFMKSEKDNDQVFSPKTIRLFGVHDELYISAQIKSQLIGESTKSDDNFKVDTVFLQTIIDGPKSLFYYLNNYGEEFYIRQDSIFELLVCKEYLKEIEGKNVTYNTEKNTEVLTVGNSYVFKNNKYLGQLVYYLKDCPGISSKINNTKYDKRNLENLFVDYYKCADSEMTFHKKHEKLLAKTGFLAGISFSNLKFEGDGFESLINTDFKQSLDFSGGMFCDIIFPRSQQKWSIYNELLYTSYSIEGTYSESNKTYYTTLEYSYIKMANMLRYSFPAGKIRLFANAGISYGYAVKENNYQKVVTILSNSEIEEEGKAIQETKPWERGLTFGLGASFKRFNIQARYDMSSGMSDLKTLSSNINRLFINVGYSF